MRQRWEEGERWTWRCGDDDVDTHDMASRGRWRLFICRQTTPLHPHRAGVLGWDATPSRAVAAQPRRRVAGMVPPGGTPLFGGGAGRTR